MHKQLLILISFIWIIPLHAADDFRRIDSETEIELSYDWPDKGINFRLNQAAIPKHQGWSRYSPERIKIHVRNQLLLKAAELQQPGLRIKLSPANLPLEIHVEGQDQQKVQQVLTELSKIQQQARQSFIADSHFYRLELTRGQYVVIPDHLHFLQQNLVSLKPVAEAFSSQYDPSNMRQMIGKVALWIQRIPYQNLSNRQESAGDGYTPPVQLLLNHQGDCDSKAVLFAGVIKNIYPQIKLHMVYFRDHAVIAAQLPVAESDLSVTISGNEYVLIDPTGPAELPLGQLSAAYYRAIQNRQFNHRPL